METIYDASILLVDDEAELRRMVEGILRRGGIFAGALRRDLPGGPGSNCAPMRRTARCWT